MPVVIKRLLLDVLKPRESSIIELSKVICSINGIDEVEVIVSEVDSKTETLKVTIKGSQIDYGEVMKVIDKHGVSIKGVDEISAIKDDS
ncbi:MAG: DUF211 domain-containing protein, partial [Euryarchaeota archaeon]|nr:DUF211 domain-containing protein [Euryarchaeota archaeon]